MYPSLKLVLNQEQRLSQFDKGLQWKSTHNLHLSSPRKNVIKNEVKMSVVILSQFIF